MKKFLSMLLVMIMIFSLGVFATETVTDEQSTSTETQENVEAIEEPEEENEQIFFKAKVLEASEVGEKVKIINSMGQQLEYPITGQDLKVVVKDGKYKGTEITFVQYLGEQGATEYAEPIKAGQKIYMTVSETVGDDGTKVYDGEVVTVINTTREIIVFATIVALLVLIILLSKKQSIRTISVIALNMIILFVTFGILYLKEIPAIILLSVTTILIIITNTLIINNLSKKTLVAIIGIIVATILTASLCMLMINVTEVGETLKIYEEETAKPEYIDVIMATTIIASLGIAINMGIKVVNEYIKGEGTLKTIKVVSSDLVKALNGALLIIIGVILTNIFLIAFDSYYPIYMIFFVQDSVFIELIKVLVVMVNPIIVIPITAILSKLLLEPTKGIDEAK